ncbi:transmembrane emp24 domain-containing protein 11-like isoform X1 [Apteryx rowi]|uniref:transmembrane emp24 domain-containing protein 11-like isoform X1 n=1 Tax=Apteryx rowi TaxID=308060 RepID=UPI0006B0C486|nr:PREDICTED: transmembrane emp24 domain-containing protein 11-like isoform X1 [Apteryx mantelli mantelli]XP_025920473.1 transmembrane emp24 domain-containing protein 11-like isoform X1 [Apteryx rowi]
MKSQLIGFLMNFWISFSPALYFHSGEREEKCIIEDVPSDTLVIGNYKVQQWDIREQEFLESAPGLGMFVTVTTPTAEVNLLSKLYGPQATFSFTSYISGEHVICLQSNSTRLVAFAGSKLRIHLDIRVGEHFLDEAVAQAKDKVNEVNFRLGHLIEQIHHISKEQNYEREREENFRKTSEQTNSNILWWAIVQTLILISVGIWQIKSLKDFFIAKKLV